MELNKQLLMLGVEVLTIHGMEGIEALEAIEKVMEINSWINDLGNNESDKLKILILNWDK